MSPFISRRCSFPALVVLLACTAGCGGNGATPEPEPTATDTTSASSDVCGPRSDGPARGRISGLDFTVESSKVENGILELRQGEEFFADRSLTVFLFMEEGELPAGRTFSVESDEFGSPHIHMGWRQGEDSMPSIETFVDKYRMSLSFGEEVDGALPGRIHLCLPDEQHSFVSGEFTARIEGFRLVDGRPDYRQDSHTNFKYLVREHLRETHGHEQIEIVDVSRSRYNHGLDEETRQTGSADVIYSVADGSPTPGRFLFVKEPDAWRIDQVLAMNQLIEAHPFAPPGDDAREMEFLQLIVARRLEQTLQARFPGRAIYPANDMSVVRSYRTRNDTAEVQTGCRVDGREEPIETEFRLRKSDRGWVIESES